MGKTKQLLEEDWYEYSQDIALHWMEQEFYYRYPAKKTKEDDNN